MMGKQRIFPLVLVLLRFVVCNPVGERYKRHRTITGTTAITTAAATGQPNHVTSEIKDEPIFIYATTGQEIFMKVGSGEAVSILSNASVTSMAFDEINKRIFWPGSQSDVEGKGQSAIFQVRLKKGNSTGKRAVFAIPSFEEAPSSSQSSASLVEMKWLEYDWVGDNVYFVDTQRGICLCNRRSMCMIVVNRTSIHGIHNSTKIALDPDRGRMYWSVWSQPGMKERGQIFAADMDGTNARAIGLNAAADLLTVDRQTGSLYWSQTEKTVTYWSQYDIFRMVFDGNGLENFKTPYGRPLGLRIAQDTVYCLVKTFHDEENIRGYDKVKRFRNMSIQLSGGDKSSNRAVDFYVFYPNSSRISKNGSRCHSDPCSHICVPMPGNSTNCLCPSGFRLLSSNGTCVPGKLQDEFAGRDDIDRGRMITVDPRGKEIDQVVKENESATAKPVTADPITEESTEKTEETAQETGPEADTPTEGTQLTTYASAGAAGGVALLILLFIVIFKCRQKARNLRNLTSEECAIFLSGGDPSALSDAPDGIHRALLLQHSKILHPDSIQIVDTGRGKLLGVGDYSMVYRGTYNSMPVVVKNVESNVNVEEFKAILAEVKTMAYVGDHKNILKFWGAEVLAIKKRKIAIVTELSPKGNLLHHLWDAALKGLTLDRRIAEEQAKQEDMMSFLNYMEITTLTLVQYCEQIASGMKYLASKGIIHGDLAARNVLVFANNVVKITGFGRCKHMFTTERTITRRLKKVSWRWASLELLTSRKFSEASDVWAFSILVWEIFSFGLVPYQGMKWNGKFIELLKAGGRLTIPACTPEPICRLLSHCWSSNPNDRPKFITLRKIFAQQLAHVNGGYGRKMIQASMDYNVPPLLMRSDTVDETVL